MEAIERGERGAGLESLWLPALALGGIAFVVAVLAWLRLRLGLDPDSLRQRLQALWHICRRRQHERQTKRGASKISKRHTKKQKWTGKPAYANVRVEADD